MAPDVANVGENWWNEMKEGSRRDQLSFNYVAWDRGLKFKYIKGDIRNNKWAVHLGPHKGKK